MRKGDTILKNDLDKAIKAMINDGTLANLSKSYIADIKDGAEPHAPAILTSKGADVVFWVSVPKNSNLFPENIDKLVGIDVSEPYYRDFIAYVGLKK